MSGKQRLTTRPQLKNTLLTRNTLRAGVAGVIADNLGASPSSVRIAQDGFANGDLERMDLYGIDRNGVARDRVTFRVNASRDGNEIVAVTADDSVDYVTRTDGGMAEALRHKREHYEKKGLRAAPVFYFTDEIARDPDRMARAQARLGTQPGPPPPTAVGLDLDRPAAIIRPGLDPNQQLEVYNPRRSRR